MTLVVQLHRGHQRIWLAGGAMAVVALSLFWYKNYYSRRRRNFHDGGYRDDLVFREEEEEDDDFDKEPDEELRRVFSEAATVARSSFLAGGNLDQRDQLMLYGLFKQATEGNRNDDIVVSVFDDTNVVMKR
jgi:hypothetical protein